MSYAEEVMNEIKQEQNAAAEAPVETVQPVETTEPVVENQPEPTSEEPKPEETPKDEPKEEPSEPSEPSADAEPSEPSEPPKKEPKPDLSKLTKEQKAEHAFQRQLAKQKEKYKAELDEQRESLKKEFQQQFDEFKKTFKKEPEEAKTREDFESDDEYIDYLSQRGVDKRMAEIAEKEASEKAEREAREKEEADRLEQQKQVADYFMNNAKTAFKEDYGEFEKLVQKGVQNGLTEVLDEAPAVRDFIFGNPDGPMVLNEMLQNKDSFVRVMSRAANPMTAIIECHDLAKEIASRKTVEEQPQPRQVMPSIGKPGAGSAPSTAPSMFKDDASLIDFVRRHR